MHVRTVFLSCSNPLSLVLFINTSSIRIITYTARDKRILCTWHSALVTPSETLRKLQGKKEKRKSIVKIKYCVISIIHFIPLMKSFSDELGNTATNFRQQFSKRNRSPAFSFMKALVLQEVNLCMLPKIQWDICI